MSREKKNLGDWGELYAAKYYTEHGFRIIERNWRCKSGETDLICTKGIELFFIEVKTRRSLSFGHPEEAVTPLKRERMARCAALYLRGHQRHHMTIHYEICSIIMDHEQVFITVYTDF